ncbi:MAG: hypothetical protein HQL72_13865 [Magnetococcales bacterium]|nr:hypothetical protein [Magnetococcales bacterium]
MVPSSLVSSTYAAYNSSHRATPATPSPEAETPRPSGDVVNLSSSGLAASSGEKISTRNPALYSNEVHLKWNLARIFMESLFGEEEGVEESAEEELVRTVVEEPLANQTLDTLSQS